MDGGVWWTAFQANEHVLTAWGLGSASVVPSWFFQGFSTTTPTWWRWYQSGGEPTDAGKRVYELRDIIQSTPSHEERLAASRDQVGVIVQVGPGDRVGVVPPDELPRRDALEGWRGKADSGAPQRGPVAGVGEHQVEPAIAVDVHSVDRATAVDIQRLFPKHQAALVPEHGGRRVHAGQDDLE